MNLVKTVIAILVCSFGFLSAPALAQDKPNILVIWGDDIGIDNISAYNLGMMVCNVGMSAIGRKRTLIAPA